MLITSWKMMNGFPFLIFLVKTIVLNFLPCLLYPLNMTKLTLITIQK